MNYRKEKDAIGEIDIENSLYYGINTYRALDNFKYKGKKIHSEIIKGLAYVKYAAAEANIKIEALDVKIGEAIKKSATEILEEKYIDQFPLAAIQGGAGTSVNMNLNEVLANLALEKLDEPKGKYDIVNPIIHVNMSQSTNDVYPTGIKIAVIKMLRLLIEKVKLIQEALQKKETEYSNIYKLGRTQLQDAVPISLGQEFGAYAEALSRDRWRLYKAEERIRVINIGGTAIGTCIGASPQYKYYVTEELRRITGLGLARSENLIDSTQNLDVFAEVSGLIKTLAITLNKIAGDLRLISSGPISGFNEINIPNVQLGSSIMPGKVNPVVLEYIQQIYLKVLSNDLIVSNGCASGELELNTMLPIISEAIIENIEILTYALDTFKNKAIDGITVNEKICRKYIEESDSTIATFIGTYTYEELIKILKESEKTGINYKKLIYKKYT